MTKKTGAGNGKGQALEEAIVRIEKSFGKGAFMRLGEAGRRMAVEYDVYAPSSNGSLSCPIPTRSAPLAR